MKTSENRAILCCQNMLYFIPGNPCQMSDRQHPPIPRRNPRQPMRSNTMSSFDQKKPTPAPRHKAGEKYFLIRAHFHSLSLASVTCLASFPGHSLPLSLASVTCLASFPGHSLPLSLASGTSLASFPGHSLDLGVAWERG